jgi:hypothetical protein
MGYWDKHPMAGDSPMDYEGDLLYEVKLNYESTPQEFEAKLPQLVQQGSRRKYKKNAFVLPFMVVDRGIKVTDPELSAKLKSFIQDGGAAERGYPVYSPAQSQYPTEQNNWNDFQSPQDYAVQLYDLWDDIMSGKRQIEELGRLRGLFEVILTNDKKGLVNTN